MVGEKRRLIYSTIAIILVGIVTGLFLGGGLLPSQAAQQQYDEKTTTSKTELTIVHAHDGFSQHTHSLITVVTVTETTSHGSFHNFAAAMLPQGVNTTSIISAPAANEVWVVGLEFRPNTLNVPVGTKVTWINKMGEEHDVSSVKPGLFGQPLVPYGSYSYTFTEPGIFDYFCAPHSGMIGSVTVK